MGLAVNLGLGGVTEGWVKMQKGQEKTQKNFFLPLYFASEISLEVIQVLYESELPSLSFLRCIQRDRR
jgi:hypothetical protein